MLRIVSYLIFSRTVRQVVQASFYREGNRYREVKLLLKVT